MKPVDTGYATDTPPVTTSRNASFAQLRHATPRSLRDSSAGVPGGNKVSSIEFDDATWEQDMCYNMCGE